MPFFPAATGLGLINSDKENVGGGSTNAESTNALALEREARSVPPPIVHFFNHPSLVKRQSTVGKPAAPTVATPRPLSNSQLINSNDNNSLDNRAYVNVFDLIMRHRNGLGISVGDGTRSMEMMNGSTAMHSGSGEDEKVSVRKMDKPVDEELTPRSNPTIPSKSSIQKSIHGSETTSPSTSSLCLSPATSYDSDSSLGHEECSHDMPLAEKEDDDDIEDEDKEHANAEGALGLSTGLFVRSRGLNSVDSDDEKEEEEEDNNVGEDAHHQRTATAQLSGFASCFFTAQSSESKDKDSSHESNHNDQDDVESIASSSSSSSPSSNRRCPSYSSIRHSIFVSQSHESSDSDCDSDMDANSDTEDGDTRRVQDDDALYLPESPWLIQSPHPVIPKDNNSPSKYTRSTSPPLRTMPSPLGSASSSSQPQHRIPSFLHQPQPQPHHQTPSNHIQHPPSPQPAQRYILTEAPALPVYERYRPIPIRVPVNPCAYSYSNMIMYGCYSYTAGGPVGGGQSEIQPQEQIFGQGKKQMSEQERLDEEWTRKEERKLREEEEERLRIRRYAAEYSSPRLY